VMARGSPSSEVKYVVYTSLAREGGGSTRSQRLVAAQDATPTGEGGHNGTVQTLNADSPGLTFIAGTHRNAAPGVGGAIGSASGSSHVTATTRTSLSPRNSRSNVARSTRSATPTAVPLFPNDSSDPYVDLCASKQVSRVQETPRRWRGGRRRETLICAPASTRPTRARRAPRASRRTRGPASWSGSRASP
jgi:hypothetical protein